MFEISKDKCIKVPVNNCYFDVIGLNLTDLNKMDFLYKNLSIKL